MPWPGTFAPIASETPSSGCTWTSSTFGRSPSPAASSNGGCGARLNWIAIVVSRLGEPLARAHVERRVGPAPVVDVELRRDERLGHASRARRPPPRGSRAPRRPRRSPRPYWPRTTSSGPGVCSARSTLTFSLRTDSAVEVDRRLHRRQREELEQVVLEDVADRAGLLVERGAPLDAERLGDGDLHVVDELAVPDRLEDAVREPQRQHVLDRLLAEVVVDAEDLAPR